MAALAFAEAVVTQRAYALAEPAPERTVEGSPVDVSAARAPVDDLRIADQVIRLMGGATDALDVAGGARELADDPALLAAFFQNLDLLPVDGGTSMDRIALLVAAALQRLAEVDPAP
jgi:hypothetical protein